MTSGYEESCEIFSSPCEIGCGAGKENPAESFSCRSPDPYSPWSGDVKIALLINFYAVWYTMLTFDLLFRKETTIRCFAVVEVITPDCSLLCVVDVKNVSIGRKCQPVWLHEILNQQRKCTVLCQSIDALERCLLLLAFYEIKSWISKVKRTVRPKCDVIGTIEPHASVTVSEQPLTFTEPSTEPAMVSGSSEVMLPLM